jgi:hypothetical protein
LKMAVPPAPIGRSGCVAAKERPVRDTARKRDRSQGTPHIDQLALGAMFEARATLYETVVHAGMGVLAAMLEKGRTRLCAGLKRQGAGFPHLVQQMFDIASLTGRLLG